MALVKEGRTGCQRCRELCIPLSINTGGTTTGPLQQGLGTPRKHSQIQTVMRGGERPQGGHQRKRDIGNN